MTLPLIYTRDQYMQQSTIRHQDYYAQFVTEDTIRAVNQAFGVKRIADALRRGDRHLNSIPLQQWDAAFTRSAGGHPAAARRGNFYVTMPFDRAATSAAGETITRATVVCIAKCAARLLVEREGVR